MSGVNCLIRVGMVNVKEIKLSVLQKLKQDVKNDLIAGLLVIIPLATTIWLTFTIASWVIDFLTRIPKQLNPFNDLNPFLISISNLVVGFAVPLFFILFIGLMARNIAGRWLLDVGERLLQAIPLAGSVYKTLKQILETILRDSNSKFSRVVLVEYPRRGIWAMAFVTGAVNPALNAQMEGPMLSVIIPTTPNPTSGWYAIVPEADVINLSIPIEDAFKVLISGGIVGANLMTPSASLLPPDVQLPTGEPESSTVEPTTVQSTWVNEEQTTALSMHAASTTDTDTLDQYSSQQGLATPTTEQHTAVESPLPNHVTVNDLSDLEQSGLTGGA